MGKRQPRPRWRSDEKPHFLVCSDYVNVDYLVVSVNKNEKSIGARIEAGKWPSTGAGAGGRDSMWNDGGVWPSEAGIDPWAKLTSE